MTTDTDFFPPPPQPASNEIGIGSGGMSPVGSIGIGPIGSIGLPFQNTVASQYANSPRLLNLIAYFEDSNLAEPDFDAFYDDVWNILTATGEGLDQWGRILVISRTLTVDTGTYFGFEEATPGSVGWNQQPFYSGPPATDNFQLSDAAYRQLLLAKAAFNICEGSIPSINQLLLNLFPGRGNCYVQEGNISVDSYLGFKEASADGLAMGWNQAPWYSGGLLPLMSLTYVFMFPLTQVEQAIVEQSGVLPTPCGVAANYLINP